MRHVYRHWSNQVIRECGEVLKKTDASVVEQYVNEILSAHRVFFVGVGRVLLSLQAIAKRYSHLGIRCAVVGEITEPALTNKDVLVVGSGSGSTLFPKQIAIKAKGLGARVVHIGSIPDNPLQQVADLFVRLPAQSRKKLSDEVASCQPMTSLFEQSLLLFGDVTAGMMLDQQHLNLESLWEFHANLE